MEYWNGAVSFGNSYAFPLAETPAECFDHCLLDSKCVAIHFTINHSKVTKCHLKGTATNWHISTSFPLSILGIKCGYIPEANRFATRLADDIYTRHQKFEDFENKMILTEVNKKCKEMVKFENLFEFEDLLRIFHIFKIS
jgi:hypothetical protein